MTEQELRKLDAPWPKSAEELQAFIDSLVKQEHDYGTCVYAMSLAATATFHYVSSQLGVTGFQASCADLDILRRTRNLERFKIVNYENLLYPQYINDEHFIPWQTLINEEKTRKWLRTKAKELLKENQSAHPNVKNHWKKLISSEVIC